MCDGEREGEGTIRCIFNIRHSTVQTEKSSERIRLLQQRQALDPALAQRWADAIATRLDGLLTEISARRVSVYMPIRGEPDLTCHYPDYAEKRALGLPLCDENGRLQFMSWTPGEELVAGRYGIAVPRNGLSMRPDAIIVPCVGFNRLAYRIGYGGGWFDRTLPGLQADVAVIGVAYAFQQTENFHPEPHDLPLRCIVTEQGLLTP